MKRLGDVWQWNPFSPFGSYALLYRKIYAYRMVYRRMAVYAIFMITYMRIYPAEYILYLHLAKQLDKQHLLKLYTLINVGRRAVICDAASGFYTIRVRDILFRIFVLFVKI